SSKKIHLFLERSQFYTIDQLEAFQLKKLKELLYFAYQYSEYYRNVFDEMQLHPSDINSLRDLQKLPIITKKILIEHNHQITTNYKFSKIFKAKTSGTSGESLVFNRDEYSD